MFTQAEIDASWNRSFSRPKGYIEQAEGCERAAMEAEAGKYGPSGAAQAAGFRKKAALLRELQAAIVASWAE